MSNQELFQKLVEEYSQQPDIEAGKMMSSPALQHRGKVFAFFYNDAMTFKLGKHFDPERFGLSHWEYLSPFKNKGPMKNWIVVASEEQAHWPLLTEMALAYIRSSK